MPRVSGIDLQDSKFSLTLPGIFTLVVMVAGAAITYSNLVTKDELDLANKAIGVLQRDLTGVKTQLTTMEKLLVARNLQFDRLVEHVASMSARHRPLSPVPVSGLETELRSQKHRSVVEHIRGPYVGTQ